MVRYTINPNCLNLPIMFGSIGVHPFVGSPICNWCTRTKEKNRFLFNLPFHAINYIIHKQWTTDELSTEKQTNQATIGYAYPK